MSIGDLPDLLTVPEVAKLLRCSRGSIYKRIERRQIPHIRLGRTILFRRVEIEKYLNDHTVEVR